MFKKYLKSKLHGVTVTEADLNYRGSITIDKDLIEAAGLKKYEMVKVINITNGERFETYVIEGERGSGNIGLNGGAARKGSPGDKLIVFSSAWIPAGEKLEIKVVFVNDKNAAESVRKESVTA
ncbi:MAG: aspartate 1-decarboxylase [Elusimicrobiota bacterium]|nr:aspartate 1-decarboxylase [Elusimicrobiota bacterium]